MKQFSWMRQRLRREPRSTLKWSLLIAILGIFLFPSFLYGEYEDELQDQIEEVTRKHPEGFSIPYFHDMGIVARKADEAGLNDLTYKIVKILLLERMEKAVQDEVDIIKDLYRREQQREAAERLSVLKQFDRFYQPTDEYLGTTGGQALYESLSRLRQNTLERFKTGCSEQSIRHGIQAIRETGLLNTTNPKEIVQLREIRSELDCCLRWKKRLHFVIQNPFKSEYEKGIMIEEADLTFQGNQWDLTEAYWTGQWIYRIEGEEGKAEGVSQANLRYKKGIDFANLVISSSRVSSEGWIDFPVSLSGDRRTIEVEEEAFFPLAVFSQDGIVALQGCRNKTEGV